MQKRIKSEYPHTMTVQPGADVGNGQTVGRKPKSTVDEIIVVAWDLFERNGFDSTTMADIATAAGISRRTLFNYFPSKEALLYPAVDVYMNEFTNVLVSRPDDEPLFASLEFSLMSCHDKQRELAERFNPGPRVQQARLSDAAIRHSRDVWATEMERAVAQKLADTPGASVQAGFVGALAAQVWTEMAKHMKASGDPDNIDNALAAVMASLRKLFV